MWLIFVFLSLLAFTSADIFGKKSISSDNIYAPFETLISVNALSFAVGVIFYLLGLGESGKNPFQLLSENPLILVSLFCFILYWLLFLLSLRFVWLSFNEAFSGAIGVFYFIGLALINFFTGRLTEMKEMIQPIRIIPIILIVVASFLFPNIDYIYKSFSSKVDGTSKKLSKAHRRRIVKGIVLFLSALIFDSFDSLITTVIFDEGNIGKNDYMIANYLAALITTLMFEIIIKRKTNKFYIPFIKFDKNIFIYSSAAVLSSIAYLSASSLNPVKTGILFIAYPIFPIIGSRIFLKEKYTIGQTMCIWVITISFIIFGISDVINA